MTLNNKKTRSFHIFFKRCDKKITTWTFSLKSLFWKETVRLNEYVHVPLCLCRKVWTPRVARPSCQYHNNHTSSQDPFVHCSQVGRWPLLFQVLLPILCFLSPNSPLGCKPLGVRMPGSVHRSPCRRSWASRRSAEPPAVRLRMKCTWPPASTSAALCAPHPILRQDRPHGFGLAWFGRPRQKSSPPGAGGSSSQDPPGWSSCTTEGGWSTGTRGRRTHRCRCAAAGGSCAGRRTRCHLSLVHLGETNHHERLLLLSVDEFQSKTFFPLFLPYDSSSKNRLVLMSSIPHVRHKIRKYTKTFFLHYHEIFKSELEQPALSSEKL